MRIAELQDIQLDALKEVANIGAGHAATALSQLISKQVMLKVPSLQLDPLENVPNLLGSPERVVAGVLMHILGDITGRMLLLFPREAALVLTDRLLGKEPGTTTSFTEMERSCISETGNILAGSYLGALGEFLGLLLLPSVPSMVLDMSGAVLTTAYLGFGEPQDFVICIETSFHFVEDDKQLKGFFFLIPDMDSLEIILKSIDVSFHM
ncbi:MAG: chemotaxis protein CheC [Gemmatimonadetes bacterium]|nr:MAG: chemotaxis protein CheC [Gemmatimonadota bacterium]